MILWYIFLGSVFSLGIPSALTYRLRRHPEQISELSGAALTLSLAVSALACTVGFFGLPHWIPQYSPQILFFARIFLLNTPVAVFMVIGRAALESQGQFTASNLSLIGPPLLTLAGLLLLWATHKFTPVNAAWCYVLSGVPSLIWMGRSFHRRCGRVSTIYLQSARLLLSYGIRSYGIDLCGTLSLYVDQALVVRILQPSMMGTYVVALSLSRMLNVFHTAVVMVLFPRAVSRPPREVLEMTGQAVRMTTFADHALRGRHHARRTTSVSFPLRTGVSRSSCHSPHPGGGSDPCRRDPGNVAGVYGAVPARRDYRSSGDWTVAHRPADACPGSQVRH